MLFKDRRDEYEATQKRIEGKLYLWLDRLYIVAFNVYSFYWLYKIVFLPEYGWEEFLLWFFACVAVNRFYRENKDRILIKPPSRSI